MTLLSRFFELMDANKPISIPTIEPKSDAEKVLERFLTTNLKDTTSKQLDEINNALEILPNINSLDALKIYNEYFKNKQVIEKLLEIYKAPKDPTSKSYPSPEKIETVIQTLLTRNEKLVTSTSRFSKEKLNLESRKVERLLEKVKPHNLENFSKVTNSQHDIINKNRYAEKLSIQPFFEYKNKIEKMLNLFRKNQPQNPSEDKEKPPNRPKPK